MHRVTVRRYTLWLLLLAIVALVSIIAVRAINKSQLPKTEADRKDIVCAFDADFHRAGKQVETEADSVAIVKRFEPRFDAVLAAAPNAIKSDVETIIGGLRTVARSGDVHAIDNDGQLFSDAGLRLDAFCDIPSN